MFKRTAPSSSSVETTSGLGASLAIDLSFFRGRILPPPDPIRALRPPQATSGARIRGGRAPAPAPCLHTGVAPPSDITAVVLTVGEGTTDRAIASVRRQTLPPRQILVIEEVTPFHRALNLASSRVVTPLFVQVDADMVL